MSDPYAELEQALGGWPMGLPVTRSQIQEVAADYSHPPRAYHGFGHILELAPLYAEVRDTVGWDDGVTAFVAMLFHDVVYVAGRSDNESRSADHAAAAVGRFGWRAVDTDAACRMILLTAAHGRHGEVGARDERLFLDMDMAILAAPPERFDAYEAQIAEEYRALPAEVYQAGRRRFLQRLVVAERIYLSEHFHTRLDDRARENLRRALSGP